MIMAVTGAVFEGRIVDGVSKIKVGIADVWYLQIKAHEGSFASAANAALLDGTVSGFKSGRLKDDAARNTGGVESDIRQRLTLALVAHSRATEQNDSEERKFGFHDTMLITALVSSSMG